MRKLAGFTFGSILSAALSLAWGTDPSHAAPLWSSPLVGEAPGEASPETIARTLPGMLARASQEPDVRGSPSPFLSPTPSPTPNPSFAEVSAGHVQVMTFRKPKDFDYEFSILIVDGKIRRAFVVSTALDGHYPVLGLHYLTPIKLKPLKSNDPNLANSLLPWPWIRSNEYDNSPMYWGLNIRGGFFIHSSPHYGNLGKPASMGCIRASIPDAMEMFNTVANEFGDYLSYSMVYQGFSSTEKSPEARFLRAALQNSNMTIEDLKAALVHSKLEIDAVSHGDLYYTAGEVPVDAHLRPFTGEVYTTRAQFSSCGGEDCWSAFKKTPHILRLKASVMAPLSLPSPSPAPSPALPGDESTEVDLAHDRQS